MKVLHLSDVHVVPDGPGRPFWHGGWRHALAQIELRLLGRAERFRTASETVVRILEDADAAGVDHVVLSGDLTALALDEEFEEARRVLGPWAERKDRLTVVPGNHDRYTPASWRQRRFERWFGHLLGSDLPEYVVHHGAYPFVRLVGDELAIVGLDSAVVPHFPGLAYGRVGAAQLEGLAGLLADPRVKGRSVLTVLHHAPFDGRGRHERVTHGLRDAKRFREICAEGGVAAVLHGHVHDRDVFESPEGVRVFNAGSSTQRGREGYWLLDVAAGRVQAEQRVDLAPVPALLPLTA